MFCPNCGKEVPDGSKFCDECGAPLPTSAGSNTTNESVVSEGTQKPTPTQMPDYSTPGDQSSSGAIKKESSSESKSNGNTSGVSIKRAFEIVIGVVGLVLIFCALTGRFDNLVARLTNGALADNTTKVVVDNNGNVYSTAPATEAQNSSENSSSSSSSISQKSSSKNSKSGTYSYAYDPIFDALGENEWGSYFLLDLNDDGIYELIIGHGTMEADYVTDFYTVDDDGNAMKIGELYGTQTFLTTPNGNGIYAARERMGYEELYRMTMSGNLLIPEMIIDKTLGENEEYYSLENPDDVIDETDISDRSLLNNYKNVKASGKSANTGSQIDYSQYDYVSPGYIKDQDTALMKEYLEPYSDAYTAQDQAYLLYEELQPDVYYKYYAIIDGVLDRFGLNVDGVKKMLRDWFRVDTSELTDYRCIYQYSMEITDYNQYFDVWDQSLSIDDVRKYLYDSELQCMTEEEVDAMSNYEVSIKWFYVMDDYDGEPIDFNPEYVEPEVNLRRDVGVDSDYILPDSDSRYYTEAEISDLTKDELRVARNEIYARHGRLFDSADLNEYFQSKAWYNGTISASAFDDSVLNDYEKKNAELIQSVENSK